MRRNAAREHANVVNEDNGHRAWMIAQEVQKLVHAWTIGFGAGDGDIVEHGGDIIAPCGRRFPAASFLKYNRIFPAGCPRAGDAAVNDGEFPCW